jgi:hypothetical protein
LQISGAIGEGGAEFGDDHVRVLKFWISPMRAATVSQQTLPAIPIIPAKVTNMNEERQSSGRGRGSHPTHPHTPGKQIAVPSTTSRKEISNAMAGFFIGLSLQS